MRYCVLDIGTNSVKLLVADFAGNGLRPIVEDAQTTRLGQDTARHRRLIPEAIERTLRTVERFVHVGQQHNANRFLAFATSAVRDASNRDEFLRAFRESAGFDCEVISGEREAELIFLGATSHAGMRDREVVVFDIGGGSIEFISGKEGRIFHKMSLDLGAVRLTERFFRSDPPDSDEIARMDSWLREGLRQSGLKCAPTGVPVLGTGGTISCLASMDLGLEQLDPVQFDGHLLSIETLRRYRDRLLRMTIAERKMLRGLPPDRADIIHAGACILLAGVEALGTSEILTSARNLRHGSVLSDAPGAAGH